MFCFSNYRHSLSPVWCWSGEVFVRQWFDVDHGEWGESKSNKDKEREKIVQILNSHAIVTVHICTITIAICTVTIAIVHLCTTLHLLMWLFFCSKCVKSVTFFILHNFARTNGNALKATFIMDKGLNPLNLCASLTSFLVLLVGLKR